MLQKNKHRSVKMRGKIINDPVYGFTRFPEPEMMRVMEHPWFQRLRRIKQMGMAHLVYPGAVHTRLHHSMGAAHLMGIALGELRYKGVHVNDAEHLGARLAILMHDIGHGPFSHGLEHTIVHGISHEQLSRLIMERLNIHFDGLLGTAIRIFENDYPKSFLHQLVSSQLDMDRMDYLNRDSFYTGVSEGVIGYDRILQMLAVHKGNLVVEEKGIHSVEKFIVARRLMYWQVYLHKTVLGAETLVINILKRAKELSRRGVELFATPALRFFLYEHITGADFAGDATLLEKFCLLDDTDITASMKVWAAHPDPILSLLCTMMMNRRLYKVKIGSDAMPDIYAARKEKLLRQGFDPDFLDYYLVAGSTSNNTYNQNDERINILMKDGKVKNISEVDNALITSGLTIPVEKFYICSVPLKD
ncbi:MAG: HD domain-containing protein [Edaphocola sp.]